VAGGVASVLTSAGVNRDRAEELQREVEQGVILLAVHLGEQAGEDAAVLRALAEAGGREVEVVTWRD
jgi:hypothetical protein